MSTNNNRLGKEVQPLWRDDSTKSCAIRKLSSEKLQRMIENKLSEISAISLKERNIEKIEDLQELSNVKRLDLSKNKLRRLCGLHALSGLGMINLSNNELSGPSSIEELRYLINIRTVNMGDNPMLIEIPDHVLRPLGHLQALIVHNCGITSVNFLQCCPSVNTLILSKNSIQRFPILRHSTLPNLAKLSIGHNALQHIPDLSCCPKLEELRVNNNQIESISSSILSNGCIKTLDVSSNLISSWNCIELLTRLPNLTNLSAKNNRLPEPPAESDDFVLREDLSAETIDNEKDTRYRRHLLGLFQVRVGKEQKLKVRLIVLDMKRVKAKWSHRAEMPHDRQTPDRHKAAPVAKSGEYKNLIEKKQPSDQFQLGRKGRKNLDQSEEQFTDNALKTNVLGKSSETNAKSEDRSILSGILGNVSNVSSRQEIKLGTNRTYNSIAETDKVEKEYGAVVDDDNQIHITNESGVVSVSEKKRHKSDSDNDHQRKKKKKADLSAQAERKTVDDLLFSSASAEPLTPW